jgi:hypothetical protein
MLSHRVPTPEVASFYRVFPFLASAAPTSRVARFLSRCNAAAADWITPISILFCTSEIHPRALSPKPLAVSPEWTPAILRGSPALPGSVRALARYELGAGESLCNLDDARQLLRLRLRPSDVVSRNYDRTRAWARPIFETRIWAGVSWWSYYDPQWTSVGLWKTDQLVLAEVRELRLDDSVIRDASRVIIRRIISGT